MSKCMWGLAVVILLGARELAAQPRMLTLDNAISAALENNANIEISEDLSIQAVARADEQLAALLPNVSAQASHTNQVINLGDRGIRLPGLPSRVGPFGTTDIRVQFAEPLIDLALIRRYQASRRAANSSEFDSQAVRNSVAAMVARLYYGVQKARAMVESGEIQIQHAESLLKLARDRQEAGAGTGLDVTRADSRLATERFRELQAQNDLRYAELQLLRAMGEPLDTRLELVDSLAVVQLPVMDVAQAVADAIRNRPELKSETMKVEAAAFSSRAARAEWFPSVQAFASYGNSGNLDAFVPTRTLGVQLDIPVFDGGRRRAQGRLAASQLHQAEVQARNARDEIELEVRVAVDNFASGAEQLRAAEQALTLAVEELDLSRLRFEAQITTQVDVLNAQAVLAEARTRQVNALFALKSAQIEYQRATGDAIH